MVNIRGRKSEDGDVKKDEYERQNVGMIEEGVKKRGV